MLEAHGVRLFLAVGIRTKHSFYGQENDLVEVSCPLEPRTSIALEAEAKILDSPLQYYRQGKILRP